VSARGVVPAVRRPSLFPLLVAGLLAVGAVARLRVVMFPAEELFRSFPSEDGYLMLTVARNLSLGLGMTHAAGTIATNGVQPLATFLQAIAFYLTGSSREAGVRVLVVVYTMVAALTALLVFRLARRLGGDGEHASRGAVLAAAVWFASPVLLFRSMNMLETGLYTLLVVAVVLAFREWHEDAGGGPWPARRAAGVGALLALAFWARNDAVFLMLAVGVAHLCTASGAAPWRRRLRETTIMAGVALVLTLPWTVHNLVRFGHVVPVSGLAHISPGSAPESLAAAGVALFEMLTLVVSLEYRTPAGAVGTTAMMAVVVLALSLLGAALWHARARRVDGAAWLVPAVLGAGLVAFYSLGFDAPYFLRRYLFPLSPFLAIVWARVAVRLGRALASKGLRVALVPAALVALGGFAIGDGLLQPRGPWRRVQFQGADWMARNADEETWVGAFQSGTVGFFHDRTINLDGKLNPEALQAIGAERHAAYVVGSPIDVLVDWATILEPWYQSSLELGRDFEWVVLDREHDFAVLRRRSTVASSLSRPAP